MQAYLNDKKLKEQMIAQVKWHAEQDAIIQGTYGSNGKYCAVGCALNSLNVLQGKDLPTSDHARYETELGIPRAIALLEDRIFEGLPKEIAKDFPLRFTQAVNVGADLSLVVPQFFVWLLSDPQDGVIKHVVKYKECEKAIKQIAKLYTEVVGGKTVTKARWIKAKDATTAAYAAAATADYSAYAAAYTAYAAAAYAAYTAYAAAATTADYAAYAAARKNHYIKMADKLIELLSNAK